MNRILATLSLLGLAGTVLATPPAPTKTGIAGATYSVAPSKNVARAAALLSAARRCAYPVNGSRCACRDHRSQGQADCKFHQGRAGSHRLRTTSPGTHSPVDPVQR